MERFCSSGRKHKDFILMQSIANTSSTNVRFRERSSPAEPWRTQRNVYTKPRTPAVPRRPQSSPAEAHSMDIKTKVLGVVTLPYKTDFSEAFRLFLSETYTYLRIYDIYTMYILLIYIYTIDILIQQHIRVHFSKILAYLDIPCFNKT